MDLMRILRNPIAFVQKDQNESGEPTTECKFATGETVLKITKEFTSPKVQMMKGQTDHEFKLVVDQSSSSV